MDDFGETAASAGALTMGGTTVGEIEVEGDIDWFAVHLTAGTKYQFNHYGGSSGAGGGTLNDPVIEGIYSPTEALIPGTFNDDFGGTTNSQVTFTAYTTGTHYLAARAFLGVTPDLGTYTVGVDVIRPDIVASIGSLSETEVTVTQSAEITVEAENLGPGVNPADVTFGVYLSTDATVTTSDQLITTLTATSINQAQSSQTLSGSLDLPMDQISGTYFLAVIADTQGTVSEADEANNVTDAMSFDIAPAPVVLRDANGQLVSVHDTLADALSSASDGDHVVVSESYAFDNEAVATGLNDLVIDIADWAAPVLTMLDTGSVALTVLGEMGVALTGNNGANILTTGADQDTIMGGDGDDTLAGLAGSDSLDGQAGRDAADYSASDSRVEVDLIADTLDGGHATGDTIANIQDVIASAFNDRLQGNALANMLRGGDGIDNLTGSGGMDFLLGDAGNDLISGGTEDDTIDGGADNDRMFGGGGNDSILGGQGQDSAFGGTGNDLIDVGSEDDSVLGQGGNDSIQGGDGSDILRGGSGHDLIEGGADNDSLFGNGNNDTLMGGLGDDSIQGNAGADQLFGGEGNDTLASGDGGDRLDGGAGDDVMSGGGTDGARDVFVFGVGYDADRINGFDQAGNDQVELDQDLWLATDPGLTKQEVIDTFGTLNGNNTILTLDFGDGEILEVQSADGIDQTVFGLDILIV